MTVGELKEILSKRDDKEDVYVETTWFPSKAIGVEEIITGDGKAIIIKKFM